MENSIVWMPHPGHFIGASECLFRLNTYVNGYIVSTIGEYTRDGEIRPIGGSPDDLYETMVFKAEPLEDEYGCCPWRAIFDGDGIYVERYAKPKDAVKGHHKYIEMTKKGCCNGK